MATSSKRTYAMICLPGLLLPVPLIPWQAIVDTVLHWRPPKTHRQVWLSLLWGQCYFLLGLGAHKVLFVPSKSLCFPSPVEGLQSNPTVKLRFPGDFQSLWWISRLGSLVWGPELLQQYENFFCLIVLQLVDHPPGGTMETYWGPNGDLLQECLCHMPCLPALLLCCPRSRHCWPMSPQETLKHSKAKLAQSFVWVMASFPASWCVQDSVCALKAFCSVWDFILNSLCPCFCLVVTLWLHGL